ncbi:MAG: adenylyl-sulfate kinase [Lachnospiraceae bacterium]|nr:adenylyl-sulfate kinase [Lachnospiraceae bacterium]
MQGVLYWITGLSGAGKTTIGNKLYYALKEKYDNTVLLDGDVLKEIFCDIPGYSNDERRERAKKYARLCKALTDQGLIVICCTIAMFDEVRDWNRKSNKGYVEVFLDVPMDVIRSRDQKGMYSRYEKGEFSEVAGLDVDIEFPKNPDITLKNDGSISVLDCVKTIMEYPVSFLRDFDRDTEYWNNYYHSKPDIERPSLFAIEVAKNIQNGNLIELGCGNGRDSLYFASKGINVTAIDASDYIITSLKEKYASDEKLTFICDDFCCTKALFMGQYDYCYSRFSIHAITEEQQEELISNVYEALKEGGKFFIEVRSVNDELFGKGEKIGRNAFKYDGHYRRFIVKEELETSLRNKGFLVSYSKEKKGFAPFGDADPLVIRIIAVKSV